MAVKFSVNTFFDRQGVIDKVGRKKARAMAMAGGYARNYMRFNMKRGGKKRVASSPGEFPRSHQGNLRRLIQFNYDKPSESVVIGPLLTKQASGVSISGASTIPEVLNKGGTVTTKRRKTRITSRIAARPFVAPTRDVAAKKLMENLAKIPFK